MSQRKHLAPCLECSTLTLNKRCLIHARDYDNAHRGSHRHVYKTPRWQSLRRQILRDQPVCQHPRCNDWAAEVDHIIPLAQGGAPYAWTNLQALCKKCHSAKTAKEMFG